MAQSSQSLGYICRHCRPLSNLANSKHLSLQSRRAFSASRPNPKSLATFTPTASPELDSVFASWREKVFLPSVLPPNHQRLIYKTSRHEVLTNPPGVHVTVQTALPPSASNASEAGEETIKLQPLNRYDRPNKKKSLHTIRAVLAESSDVATWDNLVPFMEGMRIAKEEVDYSFMEGLARQANIQAEGRWNTILIAATLVKRTGVTLSQQGLTRELVVGAFSRAIASGFTAGEPIKTLQRIVLLLEAEDHCGGEIPTSIPDVAEGNRFRIGQVYKDMRSDPVVLSAHATLSLAKVLKDHNGKDTDGSAAAAVKRLLLLNDTNASNGGIAGLIEQQYPTGTGFTGHRKLIILVRDTRILEDLIVLRAAFAIAAKIDMQSSLGKEENIKASIAVQKTLKLLEEKIVSLKNKIEQVSEDKPRRALIMANEVEDALKKL